MPLNELNKQICNCRKCRLWERAQHAVPGEGPQNAKLMIVGQNPGSEEDKTGKPFVGRAGKFLNKILTENGIKREEVFVTNIVKHVTQNNRKPCLDEIEACLPYLMTQIKEIKPKMVVLMGAVAWQTPRLESMEYFEIYHPSAAMRFNKMRTKFREQIAAVAKQLKQTQP